MDDDTMTVARYIELLEQTVDRQRSEIERLRTAPRRRWWRWHR
jgi:hypothetical protein